MGAIFFSGELLGAVAWENCPDTSLAYRKNLESSILMEFTDDSSYLFQMEEIGF